MYETRQDLVSRVSSFGAEIPTTSMQWKREAHELEWIVRQMSWAPPWTPADPQTDMETKTRTCRPRDVRVFASQAEEYVEPGEKDGRESEALESGDVASEGDDSEAECIHDREKAAVTGVCSDATPTEAEMPLPPPTYNHRDLWPRAPSRLIKDPYGYNRIPAFCFTLNLPFNYLYEIHRFQ